MSLWNPCQNLTNENSQKIKKIYQKNRLKINPLKQWSLFIFLSPFPFSSLKKNIFLRFFCLFSSSRPIIMEISFIHSSILKLSRSQSADFARFFGCDLFFWERKKEKLFVNKFFIESSVSHSFWRNFQAKFFILRLIHVFPIFSSRILGSLGCPFGKIRHSFPSKSSMAMKSHDFFILFQELTKCAIETEKLFCKEISQVMKKC